VNNGNAAATADLQNVFAANADALYILMEKTLVFMTTRLTQSTTKLTDTYPPDNSKSS